MKSELNFLNEQYSFVQSSRGALLDYCQSISSEHFIAPVGAFANKSMCDLLLHVAETYQLWIGEFGMKQSQRWDDPKPVDVSGIRKRFSKIDTLVAAMIQKYGNSLESPISGSVSGREVNVTALKLFSHVTTHEFHHKGQILTMSRLLGYAPIDTDIIRF